MQKLKQILFAAILGLTFLNPALALAQPATVDTSTKGGIGVTDYKGVDDSITQFLCTPSDPPTGRDVELCVNKMYRFGVAFGAIALVFFVVFAGYLYMTGGEAGKGKAKGIIQNALIGIGLLLGSYLLLGFINPNLLLFRPIQPPIFNAAPLPTCQDLGLSNNCIVAGSGSNGSAGAGNGSIVQIATAELGKKGGTAIYWPQVFKSVYAQESTDSKNGNTGPQIDKYFSPGGTPGQPWCAYFATWVYGQAGINTIGTLSGRGSTLGLVSYFEKNNGKKITEGTLRYFPAKSIVDGSVNVLPGDIAMYDRGTSGDAKGHTAIALGYDPATTTIASIDGNQDQSDQVKRKNRNILKECTGDSTCKLIGIGRVER